MAFPRAAGTFFVKPHGREHLMALVRDTFHANKGGGELIGNYNEKGTFVPRVLRKLNKQLLHSLKTEANARF